jgi:hypothetical protein
VDQGGRWTDMYVMRLEKRIRDVYTEAEADIEAKMMDFNRRRNIKDKIKLQELREGKITQEEYNRWRAGQAFQGKQWIAKREQIAEVLYNANSIAAKIANEQKANVFAANANYQAYALEHGAGIDFGFGIYDSATVVNLIKNDPQVLPYYTPKKSKDMSWNMHNITRQIAQGIIQGEGLDDIAKRLARETGSKNMNSMLTNARTGMTMAQNAGRNYRLKEATNMGIKVHKEWMTTFDEHTRYTHRMLDGQKVPVDKPFEVEGYKIMFPGDPAAHPSMIYNCRCTLVGDLDSYPSEYERYDNIDGKPVKDMTYTEWYNKKKGIKAPQFNQVGIGQCKSVKEVNDLLNIPGLFKRTGGADLTGCDLDSAKSVAATYEQVFAKYPQLKGKLDAPNAHPKGMEDNTYAWCYTRNGGRVEVNPTYYSNWNNITRQYEQDVMSGWHPKGTTAESIVTHEVGHAIDGLLAREGVLGGITATGEYRYASSTMRNTIMKRAAKKDEKIAEYWEAKDWSGKADKHCQSYAIEKYVSRYATKNPQEWFAECFAEYITSANPRVVATEFGKELERLVKKIQ